MEALRVKPPVTLELVTALVTAHVTAHVTPLVVTAHVTRLAVVDLVTADGGPVGGVVAVGRRVALRRVGRARECLETRLVVRRVVVEPVEQER
eukprot:2589307-Prymnesium_polylepis.1